VVVVIFEDDDAASAVALSLTRGDLLQGKLSKSIKGYMTSLFKDLSQVVEV
jgi:hypothetical protein